MRSSPLERLATAVGHRPRFGRRGPLGRQKASTI